MAASVSAGVVGCGAGNGELAVDAGDRSAGKHSAWRGPSVNCRGNRGNGGRGTSEGASSLTGRVDVKVCVRCWSSCWEDRADGGDADMDRSGVTDMRRGIRGVERSGADSVARESVFGASVCVSEARRFDQVAVELHSGFADAAGTAPLARWIVLGALKLLVFAPTLFLLALRTWRKVRIYASESIACVVVPFMAFPVRILNAVWPACAQIWANACTGFAGLFATSLTSWHHLLLRLWVPSSILKFYTDVPA